MIDITYATTQDDTSVALT